MTRLLEGIFVIGCSLVGFGMSAPEGSGINNTIKQVLIQSHRAGAPQQVTSHAIRPIFGIHLAEAKAEILGNLLASGSVWGLKTPLPGGVVVRKLRGRSYK